MSCVWQQSQGACLEWHCSCASTLYQHMSVQRGRALQGTTARISPCTSALCRKGLVGITTPLAMARHCCTSAVFLLVSPFNGLLAALLPVCAVSRSSGCLMWAPPRTAV